MNSVTGDLQTTFKRMKSRVTLVEEKNMQMSL